MNMKNWVLRTSTRVDSGIQVFQFTVDFISALHQTAEVSIPSHVLIPISGLCF